SQKFGRPFGVYYLCSWQTLLSILSPYPPACEIPPQEVGIIVGRSSVLLSTRCFFYKIALDVYMIALEVYMMFLVFIAQTICLG
uniref:Uncharacterized protein n=1 Tax=Triticum urartu TaxID=4572 RepID=A0A8R7PE60_TRIUA